MIPPELLKDYKSLCKGVRNILENVKKFRTQKSVDDAFLAITDQVAIIINSSVQQRKFSKEELLKLGLMFDDIEKEIKDLETYEWRKGVYWALHEVANRLR